MLDETAIPFSLTCYHCDTDGGDLCNQAEAEAAGWKDIEYDDGASWNFLGVCPECAKDPTIYTPIEKEKTV